VLYKAGLNYSATKVDYICYAANNY